MQFSKEIAPKHGENCPSPGQRKARGKLFFFLPKVGAFLLTVEPRGFFPVSPGFLCN